MATAVRLPNGLFEVLSMHRLSPKAQEIVVTYMDDNGEVRSRTVPETAIGYCDFDEE